MSPLGVLLRWKEVSGGATTAGAAGQLGQLQEKFDLGCIINTIDLQQRNLYFGGVYRLRRLVEGRAVRRLAEMQDGRPKSLTLLAFQNAE